MRKVVILGSTGSIGVQAIEVLELLQTNSSDAELPALRVVGLAASTSYQMVLEQASRFNVQAIFLDNFEAEKIASKELTQANTSPHLCKTIEELIERCEPDVVLNAIVGFSGLYATLFCLEQGIDVAIANKESLVAAGAVCMEVARQTGASIIPVDSEHSALQQCLWSSNPSEVEELVLTASGGPFRGRTLSELETVTVEEALKHPTWSMGGKITVDSATLMNKGLELIEAMVLFNLDESKIEVVINPTSIVHALVRHRDQSLIAHMGWPDMRVPIAWALNYPLRPRLDSARRLDLCDMPSLTFERPDTESFRCLELARSAAREGGGMPCVLNAANEVAVESFLNGDLAFNHIPDVVEFALENVGAVNAPDGFSVARTIDEAARSAARTMIADRIRV